jgi:hypothetical protein
LAGQEADAKAAVQQMVDELTQNFKAVGDPHLWTQRYPWMSVGIAAVAGFLVAGAAAPPRERAGEEAQPSIKSVPQSPPRPQSSSTDGKLSNLIWDLLRTALLGYVAAAVQPPPQSPDDPSREG